MLSMVAKKYVSSRFLTSESKGKKMTPVHKCKTHSDDYKSNQVITVDYMHDLITGTYSVYHGYKGAMNEADFPPTGHSTEDYVPSFYW